MLLVLGVLHAQAEERVLQLKNGDTVVYRVVAQAEESAQPVAMQLLRHLAAGRIEEAARLSNEPQRRQEVLKDYLASVGEEEFKRVFSEYLSPENRVVAEIAIGPRRLIIWDLEAAGHRLAGQYYVQVDGTFLMDDRPSAERTALQRVLEEHRRQRRR